MQLHLVLNGVLKAVLSILSILSGSIYTTDEISYRSMLWSSNNNMTAQQEPASPMLEASSTPREASTKTECKPSKHRSANLPSPKKPSHPVIADPQPPHRTRPSLYTSRRKKKYEALRAQRLISERSTPGTETEAAYGIVNIPSISTLATSSPDLSENPRLEESPRADGLSEHDEDAGNTPALPRKKVVPAKTAAAAPWEECLVASSVETRRPRTVKTVRFASPLTSSAPPPPAYTAPWLMAEDLPPIAGFPRRLRGQEADQPKRKLHRKDAARISKPKASSSNRKLSPRSRRLAAAIEADMKKPKAQQMAIYRVARLTRVGLSVDLNPAKFVAPTDGGPPPSTCVGDEKGSTEAAAAVVHLEEFPDQATSQASDDQEPPSLKEAAQSNMDWRSQTPEAVRPDRHVEAAPQLKEDPHADTGDEDLMAELINKLANFHLGMPETLQRRAEPQLKQDRIIDTRLEERMAEMVEGLANLRLDTPKPSQRQATEICLQGVNMTGNQQDQAGQNDMEDVDMAEPQQWQEDEVEWEDVDLAAKPKLHAPQTDVQDVAMAEMQQPQARQTGMPSVHIAEPQQCQTADTEMQGMDTVEREKPRMGQVELQNVDMAEAQQLQGQQLQAQQMQERQMQARQTHEQQMQTQQMQTQQMQAQQMQAQQMQAQQMQAQQMQERQLQARQLQAQQTLAQQVQAQQLQARQLQARQLQARQLQAQQVQAQQLQAQQLQAQQLQAQQMHLQQMQAQQMHLQQMQALRPRPSQVEMQDVSMAGVQQPQSARNSVQQRQSAPAGSQKVNVQKTANQNQPLETPINEGGLLASAAKAYEDAQKEMPVQKIKEVAATALFSGLSDKEIAIRAEGRRRNPGAKADHNGNML